MSDNFLKPHRGPMILTFGILSLVIGCFPLGIVAWIMGNGDLAAMRAGQMDPAGEQLTNAGKICGMIATILAAIGLVISIFAFLIMIGGAAVSQQ